MCFVTYACIHKCVNVYTFFAEYKSAQKILSLDIEEKYFMNKGMLFI